MTAGSRDRLIYAGVCGFGVLGLSDSVIGVAWPAIRHTFGEPLSALSLVLLASAAGYLSAGAAAAWLLGRFGAAATLTAASLAAGASCGLIAAAPAYQVLPPAALLLGAASGTLDAGLNIIVAGAGQVRLLNLIHGSFSVGTVLGPILATAAIVSAGSWRSAYLALAGAELICAAAWRVARRSVDSAHCQVAKAAGPGESGRQPADTPGQPADTPGQPAETTRHPAETTRAATAPTGALRPGGPRERALTVGSVAIAFSYAGAEFSGGQWAASYLRQVSGLPVAAAGLVVAGYWAAFAAVRLVLAATRRQADARAVIRGGCGVALAAAAALGLAGAAPGASVAALLLVGAGLAPVFPALLRLTPGRLGAARARYVIGWQLAAAGAGGLSVSALTGFVLGRLGLTALGPTLVVLVATLLAGAVWLDALAASVRPR